jgi:hypothetical protein
MTNADMRKISIAVLVAVAVTWCAATSDYSPVKPKPENDRPVLRLIQRLARVGLWVMWAAEPQPPANENLVYHAQAYDKDGNRVLDHGKGW